MTRRATSARTVDSPRQVPLFGPDETPLAEQDTALDRPLAVFKSFVYNTSDERTSLSNSIMVWDLLPKYASEHFNSAEDGPPKASVIEFGYFGQDLKFTQFPGTTKDIRASKGQEDDQDAWVNRFPGIREQAVEIALMKLASEEGGMCERPDGRKEAKYGVSFSIRQLREILRSLGHTYNHYQVVEALDILTSSTFTLESAQGESIIRGHILEDYRASTAKGNARFAPEARWHVFFNRAVAKAIQSAQYRQYDLRRLYSRRSYGINVIKRMVLLATNMSEQHPVRLRYSELQKTTSGLNYSRISDGISYLERELKRVMKDGTISRYEKELVKKRKKGVSGRPTIVDAVFTLYPGAEMIAEVKASNTRQMRAEQELGLSPRQRQERHQSLIAG